MEEMLQVCKDVLIKVLRARKNILALALQRQSGFEAWLKWELAAALKDWLVVEVEKPAQIAGHSQGKAQKKWFDLALTHGGQSFYVELKVGALSDPDWSWQTYKDWVQALHHSLRASHPPQQWGGAVLCLMVSTKALKEEVPSLLERLERDGCIAVGSLKGDYVPVTTGMGVYAIVTAPLEQTLAGCLEILTATYQPEKIILYGSYAYGLPTEDSDIDLLVIKETHQPPFQRRLEVAHLIADPTRRTPLEALVLTPRELTERLEVGDPFVTEIVQKGKILYEHAAGRAVARMGR